MHCIDDKVYMHDEGYMLDEVHMQYIYVGMMKYICNVYIFSHNEVYMQCVYI